MFSRISQKSLDRLLRVASRHFAAEAMDGRSKSCWLIFRSMVYAQRAIAEVTVSQAATDVGDEIQSLIDAVKAQSDKLPLAVLRELKACLKTPMTHFDEMRALGYRPVPWEEILGAEEGA